MKYKTKHIRFPQRRGSSSRARCTAPYRRGGAAGGEGAGGGAYSFAACLSKLTVDRVCLSRRSTVPSANRDTFNTLGGHFTSLRFIVLK